MKAILKKENTNQDDLFATFAQLEFYAQKAADAVRPCLNNGDLAGYKRFLNMMYHYTLTSGEKLKAIANNSPNQELRDYFNHMCLEEQHHYMLAKQDLKGYGLTPDPETPQEVQEMNHFWASLSNQHINGYLGALYVFENIAEKVGDEVRGFVARLKLEKNQSRWLLIHAEADLDHGAEIKEVLGKYLVDNSAIALDSARKACDIWIAISTKPFATAAV